MLQSSKPLFYILLKYINHFCGVLGPGRIVLMTPENLNLAKEMKKTFDKWKRSLLYLNTFKIFFIHVYERVTFFSMSRIPTRSYNEMERVLEDGQLKIKADSILKTTSNSTVAEIYQG